MLARLPGLQPVGIDSWLVRDDAFAAQMALRDHLLATRRADVHASLPGHEHLERALLSAVRRNLPPGYAIDGDIIRRPDGVAIDTAEGSPLIAAARLVQEDLLLLAPGAGTYRLVAAVLCFPASWTLAEKLGRPMLDIHAPVPRYNPVLAARIDRILANLQPHQPVWRANVFLYNQPDLYHPRTEAAPRLFIDDIDAAYVRVERQCLMRLPESEAVVFSIHTYVVPYASLPADQQRSLAASFPAGQVTEGAR